MRRYFNGDYEAPPYSVAQFVESVQCDYGAMLQQKLVSTPVEELLGEIASKVSLDGEFVSLNALEIWTKEKGLELCVWDLVEECEQREKAKQSARLNDQIVQELMGVKEILDSKNKALGNKERALKTR